jgi:hypothetical protein
MWDHALAGAVGGTRGATAALGPAPGGVLAAPVRAGEPAPEADVDVEGDDDDEDDEEDEDGDEEEVGSRAGVVPSVEGERDAVDAVRDDPGPAASRLTMTDGSWSCGRNAPSGRGSPRLVPPPVSPGRSVLM